MKSVIDFKKHPYHGVGFTSTPELHDALRVLTKHKLYEIDENAVRPTMSVSRAQVLSDVRSAILNSDIKIRDEDMTKDSQYRSDWIVLDDYAMRICALRVGGYGALLEARETFNKELAEWKKNMPLVEKQKELRASGLAKLTQEERNALGV